MRFAEISLKCKRTFRLSKYSPSIDLGFCILKRVSAAFFSFGIVVTKKIGCAVVRNRIKRRIRHAFWEAIRDNVPNNVSIVAIARKETMVVDFLQMVLAFRKEVSV